MGEDGRTNLTPSVRTGVSQKTIMGKRESGTFAPVGQFRPVTCSEYIIKLFIFTSPKYIKDEKTQ